MSVPIRTRVHMDAGASVRGLPFGIGAAQGQHLHQPARFARAEASAFLFLPCTLPALPLCPPSRPSVFPASPARPFALPAAADEGYFLLVLPPNLLDLRVGFAPYSAPSWHPNRPPRRPWDPTPLTSVLLGPSPHACRAPPTAHTPPRPTCYDHRPTLFTLLCTPT
ncbi:hypothetical protein B0H19DRAFT_1275241 [Mycena capillaripes]|nr:hypothetical protein B0H19DRAFT_1275241 [Mycena capillaripes]